MLHAKYYQNGPVFYAVIKKIIVYLMTLAKPACNAIARLSYRTGVRLSVSLRYCVKRPEI